MLRDLMVKSALVVLACAVSFSAHAIADSPRQIDIPAGDLIPALEALERQAAVELVFQPVQLKALRTNGVQGRYRARDAIELLLRGTPLELRTDPSGAMVIVPARARTTTNARTAGSNDTYLAENEVSSAPSSLLLAPAFAYQTGVPASAGTPQEKPQNQLQEVVVTAQKREELLKDVPITIAVLSGASLEQPDVQGVTDALSRVPGVSLNVAGLGGATTVSIRGVSAGSSQFTGSSTVGFYLDGVPMGLVRSAIFPDVNPYDLQRVEVLSGPQGTLYGASALNGVVRVITNDPDLENFDIKGRVNGSETDYSAGVNYDADVAVNAPLAPGVLALRVVASDSKLGGYIDSPVANDINYFEKSSLRLKAALKPTDDLLITLSGWLSRDRAPAQNIADPNFTVPYDAHEPYENNYDAYNLNVAYQLPYVDISSNTSYFTYSNPSDVDFLNANESICCVLDTQQHSQVAAEELLFKSKNSGPWLWTAGGFFRHVEDVTWQGLPPLLPVPEAWDDFSQSFAAFGEVGRQFMDDKLELTAGLRYFEDKVRMNEVLNFFQTPGPLIVDRHSYVATTPRVVLTAHPSSDVTAYASYAQGFRSGFPQLFTVLQDLPGFPDVKPDKLTNYELGVKTDLLDHQLSFDAAVYYMQWRNVQQELVFIEAGVCCYNAPVNASSASGPGVDLTVNYQPVPSLNTGVTVSYNDLKLDKNVVQGGAILYAQGQRLNFSPNVTTSAFVNYRFPLGGTGSSGILSASANYVASQTSTELEANSAGTGIESTVLVGNSMTQVRASFAIEFAKHWRATLFANNITNTNPDLFPGSTSGPLTWRVQPRTIGLQFDYGYR